MNTSSKPHLYSCIILQVCFVSICCAQNLGSITNATPQFVLPVGDIGQHQIVHVAPPSSTQTNYIAHFFISPWEREPLLKFSREHLHQRVQFLLDGKIVGELYLTNEIPDGHIDLPIKSREEAEKLPRVFNHA